MNKMAARSVMWIVTAAVVVVTLGIVLWLNREAICTFVNFVRDRQAVLAHLDQIGLIGPLVLMGLIGLQVLIPSLPAEPLMIASAYVYGFTYGLLMNWGVSVAVSQAVFCLARHAGRPLVQCWIPAKHLDKWTRAASKQGTIFFMLAFVIPPVPSDILIYVAGLSDIEGRRFLVANLCGRLPMIILLTLVGAYGFRITPAMIAGLTAIGVLMLVAWLYYMRDRAEASASHAQSGAARTEGSLPHTGADALRRVRRAAANPSVSHDQWETARAGRLSPECTSISRAH